MPKVIPLGIKAKDKRKAEEIGWLILKEMDLKKVSQKSMAQELDITPQAFNLKVRGKCDFKVSELITMIRILKVMPETLNHWLGWQEL